MSSLMTLPELRDRVLEFLVSHPEAASRSARRLLFTAAGRGCLKAFADAVGSEYAARLIGGLEESEWRALAAEPAVSRPMEALQEFHRILLGERLEGGNTVQRENPFAFLSDEDAPLLSKLVLSENPASLALISAFWSPLRMNGLLDHFPAPFARRVVQEIVLLERLPAEAAKSLARRYADELQVRFQPTQDIVVEPVQPVLPDEPVEISAELPSSPEPVPHSFAELPASLPLVPWEAVPEVSPEFLAALERLQESREREVALRAFLEAHRDGAPGPENRKAALDAELDHQLDLAAIDENYPNLAPSGSA